MMSSARKSLLALVALLATSLSCGREVTGPGAGGRWATGLSLAPQFPAAMQASSGANLVAFTRVRVLFRRSDGGIALDRTIDFPAGADSVALTVNVPLSASAPETGEPMSLAMYYVDAAGDTVFTGGPVQLLVRPTAPGDLPPAPVPVPVRYTGTGSSATRVAITPKTSSVLTGDVVQFSAQAFNAQNTVLAGTPVDYRSLDTTLVRVSATGAATAQVKRGVTQVIARLLTGQEDTATVTVQLRASQIAAVSGTGQTGAAGTALALPLVVRVLAADSVPVAGVPVTFAATGGGAPGQTTVNSDASGLASTTWTLGATLGAQTMTATASGLTGSPVTFTATAIAGPATQLVFTTQPSAAVAGVAIAPAVVVTARDALGLTAGGFADSVTIAIASNPSGGTLSGVRTVAAVNGVATFTGLSLDKVGAGYTLTATSAGLTTATSTGFAITPAPAATLTFTVQPAGGIPGATFAPAPQVTARDAFGNTAAYAGSVSLALGANPGSASLTGTTTVTAVNGVATFGNVQVSAPGVGYTVVASAAGLPDATSDAFTVGSGANAWINASGGNWSVASNWSAGRVPDATDAVEIALAGTYTVTVDVNPSIASLQLGGASGTQTLAMSSRTFTVGGTVQVDANGAVTLTNSTVTGSGSLLNLGRVTSAASTIALAVDNRGLLVASGSSTMSGTVTNQSGAILRVGQVDGSTSLANLTVANGMTNAGAIELTVVIGLGYSSQLTVPGGTLVNAVGGTIASLGGAAPGGTRTLAAQLDNQGTVTLEVPLAITRASAVHLNSGTIDATLANLTLTQSGAGASFTNSGTITVGTGRTLALSGGAFTLNGGTIAGSGTMSVNGSTLNLASGFSTAVTGLTLTNATVNGPATLTNAVGRTLTLVGSTINAPFENLGTAIASGSSAIGGTFTNQAGAILRVGQVDGSTSLANLTVANGMTNAGAIELTVVIALSYSSQLTVTSGTLVNAVGGTISALAGAAPGGTRTLAAQLDNQGTMTLEVPLVLSRASAVHLNSGTIDAALANLSLTQSGAGASFTNSGTITVGAGRTLAISGGAFNQSGGTITGSGTMSVSGSTLNLAVGFSTAVTGLTLTSSTVNGPATLTNAAGRTLTLVGSTLNAPFENLGTAIASGNSNITGTFTNQAGAVLRVGQVDGSTSLANLTVANGMTNAGAIELTVVIALSYSTQLTVTNGTLVNAVGGTITALAGAAPGGTRTLAAQLDNQGTVTLEVPLAITRASAVHLNSGTIDATLANLTLTQSGAGAGFTNSGTFTVGAGRTVTISGGAFTLNGGTIAGSGTLSVNGSTLNLASGFSTAVTGLTLTNATVNGPATLTNAAGRTLTLAGSTINAPFENLGTAIASGSSAIGGTFTNQAGAVLRVGQVDGSTSLANLTVANGMTNAGAIELTVVIGLTYSSQLTVTSGTLVNAVGGTITSLGGAAPGGTRTLAAQLDNQGTVTLEVPLAITGASADHLNSGTIDATLANLTVTQSGTTPSFGHSGTITVGAGRAVTISGGAFNHLGGTIAGAGTVTLSGMTMTLGAAMSATVSALTVSNSTVNGTATLTNAVGRTLTLAGTTVNAPFENLGTTIASGTSAINGAFTNAAGALLRVAQVDGSTSLAALTVNNGFTNAGAIELMNVFSPSYSALLNVTVGTLVNAPGGTIASLPGTAAGGTRTLAAQLDNQGTLTVEYPLSINRAGATHVNSGTINATLADLSVIQGGTSPSFTNSGSMAISAGRTVAVAGGTFTDQSGAVSGAGSLVLSSTTAAFNGPFPNVAAVSLTGVTATIGSAISNGSTAFTLTNSTLNGTGPFTNPAGLTLTLVATTVNVPLVNEGILRASGSTFINGALTAATGSVLRIGQIDGTTSNAHLTVANGFTNTGAIELTVAFGAAYAAQLTVTTGTLVNASGATIAALGGQTPGGARTITAQLDNQGTLDAQVPLSLNRASADHVNGGTITLSGGDLTITQSGTTPSFVHQGSMTLAAGRTLAVTGGAFTTELGATITGGTLALANLAATFNDVVPAVAALSLSNVTANFTGPVNTAALALTTSASTLNGAGTLTNPDGQTFTLVGTTVNMPVANAGLLRSSGASAITGALTTASTSVVRIGQIDGTTSNAHLTVANGFTNNGTIELTVDFGVAYAAQLTVTTGTLVNESTGIIRSLLGTTGGGARTLSAQLDNRGLINAQAALTINKADADHVNTGTIELGFGNISLVQSGATPSFANAGPLTISTARTLTITAGTFTSAPGATVGGGGSLVLGGAVTAAFNGSNPGLASLDVSGGSNATFAGGLLGVDVTVRGSTLGGSSSLINLPGDTVRLLASTLAMRLDNRGLFIASGTSAINDTVVTAAGSQLRVGMIDGSASLAQLTLARGFTNNGLLTLTNDFTTQYDTRLVVSTGTLVNATGATIETVLGAAATSGLRAITGTVDNQGTLTVRPGGAQRLTITGNLTTSGTINLEVGGITADTQYDRILVSGTASLGGTLGLAYINGLTTAPGTGLGLLTAGTLTGTFASVTPLAGFAASPTYTGNAVTLVVP